MPRGSAHARGEWVTFGLGVAWCWNVGRLPPGAFATTVVVAFDNQRIGIPVMVSVRMAEFSGGGKAGADQAYEVTRRAIVHCGTSGFQLPVEEYDQWREIEATLNSEGMQFRCHPCLPAPRHKRADQQVTAERNAVAKDLRSCATIDMIYAQASSRRSLATVRRGNASSVSPVSDARLGTAGNVCSPCRSRLSAAFSSRSCSWPHASQR